MEPPLILIVHRIVTLILFSFLSLQYPVHRALRLGCAVEFPAA